VTVPFDKAAAGYADVFQLTTLPHGLVTWSLTSPYESLANGTVLLTERIYACRVPVWDGLTVTGISWLSSSQVASGMTVQISAIHDEAGLMLRQSTDRTSTAWPVSTWGDFTLTSSYSFTYTGFSHVSLKITATTQVPSLSTRTFSGTLAANAGHGAAPSPDNRVLCGTAQTVAGATMPNLTLPLAAVGSLPVVGLY
jgi:hypothetical protein